MVDISDLTEQEIAIICKILARSKGKRSNYFDPGTIKARLPPKFRSDVPNAMKHLFNLGFFDKNPKHDSVTYHIRKKLTPDNKKIIDKIDSLKEICVNVFSDDVEEKKVPEKLRDTIEAYIKRSKNVNYVDMNPSEVPIDTEMDGATNYYKAKINISVRCPRTGNPGKYVEIECIIGYNDLSELIEFYCPHCSNKHVLRYLQFQY